jgi:hypothetical protein
MPLRTAVPSDDELADCWPFREDVQALMEQLDELTKLNNDPATEVGVCRLSAVFRR